jgi:tripartite-type tricarboxylate transporter receptor subunit TctC
MKSRILSKMAIIVLVFTVGLIVNTDFARSEEFPTKAVTLVSCFGAGGGTDVSLRALSSVAHGHFGQPAMVIDKPGGAGIVAGDYLLGRKKDGYTVANLVPSGAVPEVYTHFRKATYKSGDLKPVCLMNIWPFGLYVKGDSKFQTLEDLIKYAKQNPGKMTYAHNGRGHSYHLLMELVKDKNKITTEDVPFKSGSAVAMQVMGGHVDFGLSAVAGTVDSLVKAGKLKLLAVHHDKRLPVAPDVPTFGEMGYTFRPHYGALFVPKGTPDEIVAKLGEGFKKSFEDKAFKSMMKRMGFVIKYEGPETVKNYMKMEKEVVKPLLEKLGFSK